MSTTVLVLSSPPYAAHHDTEPQKGSFATYRSGNASTGSNTMSSVKDSFDSDPSLESEFLSLDEILKAKKKEKEKKKLTRGAPIPEGIAIGFKKASELLRDAEATRLKFEALSSNNPTEESRLKTRKEREKAAAEAGLWAKATTESRQKQDAAEKRETDTSRYFAVADVIADHIPLDEDVRKETDRSGSAKDVSELVVDTVQVKTPSGDLSEVTIDSRLAEPPLPEADESCLLLEKPNMESTVHQEDITSAEKGLEASRLRPGVLDKDVTSTGPNVIDLMDNSGSSASEQDETTLDDFRNLVHAYCYTSQTTKAKETPQPVAPAQPEFQPKQSRPINEKLSPNKSKMKKNISPQKKKQLTMTERAVEEFRPEEVPDSLSLLEYFPIANPTKEPVPEEKSKSKPKSRRLKKGEKRSSLLPPCDALQSLSNQKFVFNTSSQLLMHSSPSIGDSAEMGENRLSTASTLKQDGSFIDLDSIIGPENVMGFKSTKSLWSAATRNQDGSLMASDIIDLSETPTRNTAVHNSKSGTVATSVDSMLDSDIYIDDLVDPARGRTMPPPDPISEPEPRLEKSIPSLPRSLGEAATRQRPTSKSPVKKKRRTKSSEPRPMKPEDAFKKVSFTDLKEELKGFGVKPPRSRTKAVELILQCRAQQTQNPTISTTSLGADATIIDNTVPFTSETAATNSNDPDSTVAIVHHIQTIPVSSQPKRRRSDAPTATGETNSTSFPPPSYQTPAEQLASQEEPDEAKISLLMSGIHDAIMSQPPTHSIANPSWREKIAMYDPIVLEEITAWLNTGGLDAVGVDAEVWPTLVRDWCESKSVCFVWAAEGWRKNR